MYNYPPFAFPSFRGRHYGFYNNRHSFSPYNNVYKSSYNNLHNCDNPNYKSAPITSFPKDSNCKPNLNNTENIADDISSNYDDNIISIFGFDLHFDDLLIIALLFFLYKERC